MSSGLFSVFFAAFAGLAIDALAASVVAAHLANIAVFAVVLPRTRFLRDIYFAYNTRYFYKSHNG
jgi:hypothetical protein